MSDWHEAVRAHLAAGAALLDRLDVDADPAPHDWGAAADRPAMGVQIDPTELAKLVELAHRMGLAPTLVLKLALEALEQQLGRPRRMVGKERGLLEAKR